MANSCMPISTTTFHKLAQNILCASCGCIGPDDNQYVRVSIGSDILNYLMVDPIMVPFDFQSRYEVLKEKSIMIDDLGVSLVDGWLSENGSEVSLCQSCHPSLAVKRIPGDALGNYRWIGDVPEELQGCAKEEDPEGLGMVFRERCAPRRDRLSVRGRPRR